MRSRVWLVAACLVLLFGDHVWAAGRMGEHDTAQLGLAKSLNNLKKYAEAETVLQSLYSRFPDDRDVAFEYAKSLGFGGKVDESVAVFERLEKEFAPDPLIARTFTDMLEANQRAQQARDRYIQLLKADPGNLGYLQKIAELSFWARDYAAAASYYRRCIAGGGNAPEARMKLADALRLAGDVTEAVALYEQSGVTPENDKLRAREMAGAYRAGGRVREARDLYRRLADLYPDDMDIMSECADFSIETGDSGGAEKILAGIRERGGGRPDVLRRLAGLYAARQRYDEAVKILNGILSADPGDKETRLQMARICSWNKRYADSIALYDVIIRENPDWVLPRREKARVLGWIRRYSRAVKEYEKIPSTDEEGKVALREKSAKEALYRLSDARAIREYRAWLEREPGNMEALFDLGQVYSRQMLWEDARRTYAKTLAAMPAHFRAEQADRKAAVMARDILLDSGYESYEADSASREADERYRRVYNSLRFPLTPRLSVGLGEDTSLYSFAGLSSVTRQRFSWDVSYRGHPYWDIEFGDRYSLYSDAIGSSHNYHSAFSLVPAEGLRAIVSLSREDVTDNAQTVKTELRSNQYGTRLEYMPSRRMAMGADYYFSDFNDGNRKNAYGLDLKGTLSYEPKRLTVLYRYEAHGFDGSRDLYFTPDSFHTSVLGVEWQQHLNSRELFWGDRNTYYTVRYSVNFDVRDQRGHVLYADVHKDWTDRLASYVSWQAMIYEHRDNYGEQRAVCGVRYYF